MLAPFHPTGACFLNMEYRNLSLGLFAKDSTKTISKLYSMFSNLNTIERFANMNTLDLDAKGLVDVLCVGLQRDLNVNYEHIDKQINNIKRNNNVVVAFSGGKDSTATALKMKSNGKNVYLFYVKGINKAYPDEMEHALELADKLGMPIHIESVKQTGYTSFKESPIKNQLIASMALDYAIENNIGCSIAFGDFTTDNVNNSQFMESWSDTQEMWNAWVDFEKTYVPNIELIIPFSSYNDTMDIISNHKQILESVCGCILPYRFRKTTRNNNEKKYGIRLLPNRCGSCWKCCTEYIYLVDKGVLPLNLEFYNHCLDFLVKKTQSVHPEISIINKETSYKAFLHYNFSESILNKE